MITAIIRSENRITEVLDSLVCFRKAPTFALFLRRWYHEYLWCRHLYWYLYSLVASFLQAGLDDGDKVCLLFILLHPSTEFPPSGILLDLPHVKWGALQNSENCRAYNSENCKWSCIPEIFGISWDPQARSSLPEQPDNITTHSYL